MPTFEESVAQFFARPENDSQLPKDANIPENLVFQAKNDKKRFKLYRENTWIYNGEHTRVWPELEQMTRVGLDMRKSNFKVQIINDAQPITDAITNLMFREPPAILTEDAAAQQEVDVLVASNNFPATSKEAARQGSYLGDAVAQIWYGVKANETEPRTHIRFVHPQMFIGEFDPIDSETLVHAVLQYALPPVVGPNGEVEKFVYRQVHHVGLIFNQLWLVEKDRMVKPVPLARFPQFVDLDPVEETGVDELLVELIKNRVDASQPYGMSDYTTALKSKFFARSEVMTQYNMVRAKHSNPKLAVPANVLKALRRLSAGQDTSGLEIRKEDLDVIGFQPGDGAPQYITWDGQLTAAREQFKILGIQIAEEAKLSPSLLGRSSGALEGGETGRANTIKLLPSLGLAHTKEQLWVPGIRNIFRKAQKLENSNRKPSERFEVSEVNVVFSDGLPSDLRQSVEVFAMERQAGLKSQFTAIKELTGHSDQMVNEEIARIKGEAPETPVAPPENSNNNDDISKED